MCDDPHNVEQAESEAVRESTLTWWDETMSTRGNDPTRVARVIVMQRVHENDLTAHCLDRGGYEHLCLPMEYEVDHPTRSSTSLGFVDPRKKAGQLLWADRFTAEALAKLKRSLGEYGTAGQLQQRPTPRGGGMFKAEHLKLFPADRPMPAMHFVIQSYDTAFTEQTTNDPTACTVWGIWEDKAGKRNMLLLDGWDEHLRYSRARARIIKDWSAKYGAKSDDHANPGRRPDVVLVEDKGSGIAIIQELRAARVPAQKYNPGKADKVSRGEQALPIYEMGTVWIPEAKQHATTSDVPQHVRQYASFARPFVIQLTKFGPGVSGHDDYVDTFTQTVIYCRDAGWLDVDVADEDDDVKPKVYGKKPVNPYD